MASSTFRHDNNMKPTTTAVCLAVFCLACLVQESNARPPWLDSDSRVFTQSAACSTDTELLDLCQRCAKLTKAKNALGSCCSSDIEARRYCRDYVYFGSVKYDFID